jgi:hypothetical protein
MVSIFGEGMGVDARSQKLYARAHVVVHVFGTLSAILITVFRANGHKLHSNIAIVAMLTCGGYGIVNMIGFTSTSRVAVAEAKTAVNTAAERQYQAALAAKKAEIAWTRNTVVNEVNRKEKRRLEEALEKKEKELAEIRPPVPTATTVLADPQATLFERLIGWTAENWQLVLPIPVAFLIYAAEALSFIFAVHLAVGAMVDFRAARSSRQRGGEDGGSCGPSPAYRVAARVATSPSVEVPAASPTSASSATIRSKMSRDQLDAYLHQHASGLASRISQRKMAAETGWSQSSACRKLRRQREGTARGGGGKRLQTVPEASDTDDAATKMSAILSASRRDAGDAAVPSASRGDAGDATAASASPTSASLTAASRRHPAAFPYKMSPDELHAYLHQHASRLAPRISQRKMAEETGWSQPSVCRKLRRQWERTVHAAGKRLRTVPDAGDANDAGNGRRCHLHCAVMQVMQPGSRLQISDAGVRGRCISLLCQIGEPSVATGLSNEVLLLRFR